MTDSDETFYKKVGRRYVPVSRYSREVENAYDIGCHLIINEKYSRLTLCRINPAFAPLIAAASFARNTIATKIRQASEAHFNGDLPDEIVEEWKKFCEKHKDMTHLITYPAAFDILEAGIEQLVLEADKLLQNPTVKEAYEQFITIAELAREKE